MKSIVTQKEIDKIVSRNIYLESVLLGLTPPDTAKILDSPLIFLVKLEKDVLGVFFDESAAATFAEGYSLADAASPVIEPWVISGKQETPSPSVSLPNGTIVSVNLTFNGENRIFEGTIVSNDGDFSCGLGKLVYRVLPLGLPFSPQNCIMAFHSEILGLKDDKDCSRFKIP